MRSKLYCFALMMFGLQLFANVSLPSFFSDNMVLQRNADVKLWGWGSPNEEIKITTGWDSKTYTVKPNNQATWQLGIKTPKEGGPYTLTFKGYNELTFNNVMLGEVWLCSGQSNMEWTPNAGIDNAEAEIAKATYPDIRFFNVQKLTATSPQINMPGSWQTCTPQTMKYFSAIGYFFAQHLQEDLKGVPIGVINSSWGGTPAEIWMPEVSIAKEAILASAAAKLTEAQWGPHEPGRAHNAMIHPLAGFKLAGVLWYQGESNTGSEVYDRTLAALIQSWRAAWQVNFPFYYVQIAPFNYEGGTTQGVTIRDAQRRVLQEVQDTEMVVIGDISPVNDIHPRNKKPVGIRLANLALSNLYGIDKGLVNGPMYKDYKVNGRKLTVHFYSAEGLHFSGKNSMLFELAGPDEVYYPASARIEKNTVILSSNKVKSPTYVRYAWHNNAQPDLFNNAKLPASSFTSK